jgi:hypothetical protein
MSRLAQKNCYNWQKCICGIRVNLLVREAKLEDAKDYANGFVVIDEFEEDFDVYKLQTIGTMLKT